MFGKGIKLFTLFGFDVKIDLSWLIIAILITWSLAGSLFPAYYQDLSTATYIWMGIAGAAGLFLSIIIHEFSHSLVARKYGLNMKGITLFIFGGVAEMPDEPQSPKAEFYMAIAGPIASIVIGGVFFGLSNISRDIVPEPLTGVMDYLALINIILAGFNLIPAFPLDGGRILRSALWSWKKSLRKATRISSNIGAGFGIFLILLGIFRLIAGNFIGGLWMALIGMFLKTASQRGYEQVLLRDELKGEPIRRFTKENPITVADYITLREFVEDYVYKHHHKMFPVTKDSYLAGYIDIKQIKDIPKDEWETKTVGSVSNACNDENTIRADADAMEALSKMKQRGNSRLMVVDNGNLVGVVSLKDMLEFLSLKLDLETD